MIISDDPFAYLFGVYLGEDWPEEYGSWETAGDALRKNDASSADRVRRRVEKLLMQGSDEATLEAELDRVGCSFDPQFHGSTYREWLTAVATRMGHGQTGSRWLQ